ncbi:RES family NAD+ phosphorylase [Halomonas sp. GD1P12]|uniref:RES family NAD+ phosphorylase n=1 Tax=Halomonas sp. GD1P12 TaxID=2982691 RepID=UPI0021E37613|nr:RES family NAD+ phosphorylase [Halomonas sp. GD1P12]UYG01543.1 RES family NAD+ phosphorylase [Halomonas sp. GD1P12]
MVAPKELAPIPSNRVVGYRLINSKFPPIALFDDVADRDEFEALYQLQALTNPRLCNELGNLALLPLEEIPFHIRGCSYAAAAFTHVNPDGSRFSDGSFGVLYIADTLDTAIAEVSHHQTAYWERVPALHFERFVFRGLRCTFDEKACRDGLALESSHTIYDPDSYTESRTLGHALRRAGEPGLRYRSVRREGAVCWALMTPRWVEDVVQTTHIEMVWNAGLAQVNRLTTLGPR